jgi:hypothetical protein
MRRKEGGGGVSERPGEKDFYNCFRIEVMLPALKKKRKREGKREEKEGKRGQTRGKRERDRRARGTKTKQKKGIIST